MPNMESKPDIFTLDLLRSRFIYCKESGNIISNVTDQYRTAGDVLGTVDNGYIVIFYNNHYTFAHRLAFMLVNGFWPLDEVDHINRIKSDNRWSNLRSATRLDNVVNRGLRIDNTTGLVGVSLRKSGTYRVRLDGFRLGDFKDFFEACCVRKSAEQTSKIRQQLR